MQVCSSCIQAVHLPLLLQHLLHCTAVALRLIRMAVTSFNRVCLSKHLSVCLHAVTALCMLSSTGILLLIDEDSYQGIVPNYRKSNLDSMPDPTAPIMLDSEMLLGQGLHQ